VKSSRLREPFLSGKRESVGESDVIDQSSRFWRLLPALLQLQTCATHNSRKAYTRECRRWFFALSHSSHKITSEQYYCFIGKSARSQHVGFLEPITLMHAHAGGGQPQP
jgi:hypothetical protein